MMHSYYRNTIEQVEAADWIMPEKEWSYIEDEIKAVERALDEAMWEGEADRSRLLTEELRILQTSLRLGEEYVTSW